MKYLQTILFFFLLSCQIEAQTKKDISGHWTLICIDTNECRPEDKPYYGSIDFQFTKEGKLHGHTSTNKVYGDFQLLENNKMIVSSFGGTKVGEFGFGRNIWKSMSSVSSYKLESDTLYLYYDNDQKVMTYIPYVGTER